MGARGLSFAHVALQLLSPLELFVSQISVPSVRCIPV